MNKEDYEIIDRRKIELFWRKGKELNLDMRDLIEDIWRDEVRKNKNLYESDLLNLIEIKRESDGIKVFGVFISYKQFLAHRIRPELGLCINPIGVSGVTIFEESGKRFIIFARRNIHTTEYPGLIEMVPSGGVDRRFAMQDGSVDYKSALLEEYTEETGLAAEKVERVEEIAFIFDKRDGVYDICCRIYSNTTKKEIREKFPYCQEYESPIFVEVESLTDFVRDNSDMIVPTSKGISLLF